MVKVLKKDLIEAVQKLTAQKKRLQGRLSKAKELLVHSLDREKQHENALKRLKRQEYLESTENYRRGVDLKLSVAQNQNAELRRRLSALNVRDYEPTWMDDDIDGLCDLDSIACYVAPRSVDVLAGPVLHLATSRFRCKGDRISQQLCQVTTDPMIFIPLNAKDRFLKAIQLHFQVVIPSLNPTVLSKKSVPISKRTLIRCLSQTVKSVWIVRHGLKDQDLHYLSKKIQIIPHSSNRVDIGAVISTSKVNIFYQRSYNDVGRIYPMFLRSQGSILTRVDGLKVKIYPNFAHILKYGCSFSKNPHISRLHILRSLSSLEEFFQQSDFTRIRLGNRFQVTLLGVSDWSSTIKKAEEILTKAKQGLQDHFAVTQLSFEEIKKIFLTALTASRALLGKRVAEKLSNNEKEVYLAFLNAAGWSTQEWIRLKKKYSDPKKIFQGDRFPGKTQAKRAVRGPNGRFIRS